MAKTITFGVPIVWGVCELKPIVGAPEGRQRLRLRRKCEAHLFIKTADGIRDFLLVDRGNHWFVDPQFERARNWRPKS